MNPKTGVSLNTFLKTITSVSKCIHISHCQMLSDKGMLLSMISMVCKTIKGNRWTCSYISSNLFLILPKWVTITHSSKVYLSFKHPQTRNTVNTLWARKEATVSLLDNRKCEHSKIQIHLCLHRNRNSSVFLKNCNPCYSKEPSAKSAVSVAYWFQGTQHISQHYNQAKSLPVGWLQEGHNDSHRTASWEVKSHCFQAASAPSAKNVLSQLER